MSSSSLDRVVEDRPAGGIDRHPAVTAVAGQVDEAGAAGELRHPGLVVAAGAPGERRRGQPGRVLGALDQESVAVTKVRELVREPRLRRTPPGILPLLVVAEDRRSSGAAAGSRRPPGRRSRSAAAAPATRSSRRRRRRSGPDDDLGAATVGVEIGRLDPGRPAVLDDHPLDPAVDEEVRLVGGGVGEVGLRGRALRARLVAEAQVARGDRVVGRGIGVAGDRRGSRSRAPRSPPAAAGAGRSGRCTRRSRRAAPRPRPCGRRSRGRRCPRDRARPTRRGPGRWSAGSSSS